jgi:ABC-2 type transport system ATP-binding protein
VTAALETRALRVRYGKVEAIAGLDLTIPTGKIVGLVGPNGAGKTTLLHVAIGLLRPDAGAVQVLGWSPRTHLELLLSRVAFVAQDRPLYASFSVADTLELGRRLNPRWDHALARGRLERLEIDMTRAVGRLSGGQQAQVALALALGKRPDLLLLDEPVAHLDPLARRQFLGQLMDAAITQGCSVVLSSHVVADLERVCDYLVILTAGELQLAGDVDGLIARHGIVNGHDRSAPLPQSVELVTTSTIGPTRSSVVRVTTGACDEPGVEPIGLEDLVLAYLATPTARNLPAPAPLREELRVE